jgi:hypothetical protein
MIADRSRASCVENPPSPTAETNRPWSEPKVRRLATSEAEFAPTSNLDGEGHAS